MSNQFITPNFYKIYGLTIKSDIEIHPYLKIKNHENKYDINILIGDTIKDNSIPLFDYGVFKYYKNRINITINNVASYDLINGCKIVVNPSPNASINDVKKYIIGSCLGLLLFQRNTITLHGGALCINNTGVIISGNIGAGKTTLVSKFIEKNYPFLSDDVSVITTDDNKYVINSSFPQQKLCEDTVLSLGYDLSKLELIDEIKNKYYGPIVPNFTKTPCEFKYFFYINCSDCDKVSYSEINGVNKFQLIFNNIYRTEVIPKSLFSPMYIKKCLQISNKIKVYQINRPKNSNTINELTELIEKLSINNKLSSVS